jgi:hypothetical protein
VRALFSCSPVTGKTFAADIPAGSLARNQNHLGLCALVTKYIGETNPGRVIEAAKPIGVVFFFEEYDAPFGKRTATCGVKNRRASSELIGK